MTHMIHIVLQTVPDKPYPSMIAPIILGGKIAAYPKTPPWRKALKAPESTIIMLMITSAELL